MIAMPIGGTSIGLYPGTLIFVILILKGSSDITDISLFLHKSITLLTLLLSVASTVAVAISQLCLLSFLLCPAKLSKQLHLKEVPFEYQTHHLFEESLSHREQETL